METLFIGKNIIFLPETDSTNSYATLLLKNVNLAEGTVIHTTHQTQGKGQRGSSWNTDPASNLTASIVLKPGFLDIKEQFFLYQIAALACYDTLSEILNNSHFDIKIKWPNDLLVNRQKIAGILIENNILNGRIVSSVIGVGINVNQAHFSKSMTATSLRLQLLNEKPFEVKDVLTRLCVHLEKHYLALKNGHHDEINANYLSHFFGLNSWMNFDAQGVQKELFVKGITENGLLQLEARNGSLQEADVKDVKWIY